MRRWLRQHRYALLVAVRRLVTQPFSSLANILVIGLSLAVPIIAASVLVSAQPIASEIPVSPELTLFLDPSTSNSDAVSLAETLRNKRSDAILDTRLITREQALQSLKANPSWSEALAVLPDNPLPDAIIVTLRDSPDLALHANELAQEWRNLPQVDSVQLDSDWVRRLEAILGFIKIGLGMLAIGVALVVLATVFNTVRMQALTQREEIGVARLVGATESFVRRPFLYLGALTGIVASVTAIGLAALALQPINTALARLASQYGAQFSLHLPDPLSLSMSVALVAILAALSARWSVTRNTRF
ncbi:cell division protein FtsX [Pollutimonas harenae]|uniref:Cell division protein FtsX n=1 Tax=Pollutimonas harenae TaxID=657015 RepID=A0A853H1H6_9BURK|nr:ABC transporter permease [Pollutimonas harenae]NYT85085.1 ABC transporter permease [Pollutimonas harenae]TEA72532.1 ABC transporter permease [Pollutimonas harenae]